MSTKTTRGALDHVCAVFHVDADRIRKHNKECLKLTRKHARPWPEEGTWDKDQIADMKKIIGYNYKGLQKDKREATLKLFKLFKEVDEKEEDIKVQKRNPFAVPQGASSETPMPSAPPPPYQGAPEGIYPVLGQGESPFSAAAIGYKNLEAKQPPKELKKDRFANAHPS